jgi:hypothetical protein
MRTFIPMNLQFFADPAEPGGQTDPPVNQPAQQSTVPEIDYDRLSQLIAGKQTVAEDTVLKSYFKQQGLSKEEMGQAIAMFKEHKAANEPDISAIQQQLTDYQKQTQQAVIERDAVMLSGELGIDLKTMPYVLKLADLNQILDDGGNVDKEKLKIALNQVLDDVPQLKPQPEQQQSGFRQIGVGAGQQNTAQQQQKQTSVPTKRWNRFNN